MMKLLIAFTVIVLGCLAFYSYSTYEYTKEIQAETERMRIDLHEQMDAPARREREWTNQMKKDGWVQGPPGTGWFKDNKPYMGDEPNGPALQRNGEPPDEYLKRYNKWHDKHDGVESNPLKEKPRPPAKEGIKRGNCPCMEYCDPKFKCCEGCDGTCGRK